MPSSVKWTRIIVEKSLADFFFYSVHKWTPNIEFLQKQGYAHSQADAQLCILFQPLFSFPFRHLFLSIEIFYFWLFVCFRSKFSLIFLCTNLLLVFSTTIKKDLGTHKHCKFKSNSTDITYLQDTYRYLI